jgi:hypothetical protein
VLHHCFTTADVLLSAEAAGYRLTADALPPAEANRNRLDVDCFTNVDARPSETLPGVLLN